MSEGAYKYKNGSVGILDRAEAPHVGTQGIRYRAATDIANSGVWVKIGMALTAHETAAIFMRHVHAENNPVREAVDRAKRSAGYRVYSIRASTEITPFGLSLP